MSIKNVLYFFPQMMDPIDPSFRDTFLQRDPEVILFNWLEGLLKKNREYESLLEQEIFSLKQFSGEKGTLGLQLPIKLVPGTLHRLYRKLCQIQDLFQSTPNL